MPRALSRREWARLAAASGLIRAARGASAAEDPYATMPSNDEIYSWIVQLWKF